ncbi:MAG: gliding motility-associated ABC transporter ATP-binding subunit GldA [Flavobacteriales bacterium]|nr:gliding motility-associated ABC transporter ATP-binding subunit GldA [Flavobacteriales bacterium]MCZ2443969.1 gliding motility-associated ABC transporter ATP-binding subunit GldA [Flavobacteriales bacterium]
MSIKVQNITKFYGLQKALDAVSFDIPSGQIVGFLGPNGAGKSTMMKILTGFIPPSEGQAQICEFDIRTQIMDVRRHVGYLPEHNPLYVEMYVVEYLRFVAGMYGMKGQARDARVREMIDITGLGAEYKKKIRMLSKGYRQRVGLAQALIHNPKVLILDEPTSGLDPNQLVDIRNLIISLGKEKTVMLSTHIMQEVEAMCKRVIIIDKGQIKTDDEMTHVQQHMQESGEFVEVEFDAEVQEKDLKVITGVRAANKIANQTWLLEAKQGIDIRPALFQWAVEHNIGVLTLKKKQTSLEDIFQSVTKNKK